MYLQVILAVLNWVVGIYPEDYQQYIYLELLGQSETFIATLINREAD